MSQLPPIRRCWQTRVPWLVVGVVVGALFMRTWPGQTKTDGVLEMAKWVGGGLVAGVVIDFLVSKNRFPLLQRPQFWLAVAGATAVTLASGNGFMLVVISLAICGGVFCALLRAPTRRHPTAPKMPD